MPFQQNNNFNSNNGEEKKRTNFKVGRIYGSDGQIDVDLWKSEKGGTYATATIKRKLADDPSTGGGVYDTRMSKDLPSIVLNAENTIALLNYFEGYNDETISKANFTLDTQRGAKIGIVGSSTNVKLTIENQKNGSATVTLSAIPVGPRNIHSQFILFLKYLAICSKKQLFNKLDPDEFSTVIANGGSDDNDEDAPF